MKRRIRTIAYLATFLCMALLWTSPSMAEEYLLSIAGKTVTSDNCNDLSVIDKNRISVAPGGKFSYNHATQTLTMKDVTVGGST